MSDRAEGSWALCTRKTLYKPRRFHVRVHTRLYVARVARVLQMKRQGVKPGDYSAGKMQRGEERAFPSSYPATWKHGGGLKGKRARDNDEVV